MFVDSPEGATESGVLYTLVETAKLNIDKVSDLSAIAGYGIMSTPGLVINEKVVSFDKVLKPDEVVKILEKVL